MNEIERFGLEGARLCDVDLLVPQVLRKVSSSSFVILCLTGSVDSSGKTYPSGNGEMSPATTSASGSIVAASIALCRVHILNNRPR